MSVLRCCLLALLVAVVPASVSALEQKPLLEAELVSFGKALRDRAPIPVQITVTWRGTGILEGRLHWRLFEGSETYAELRGREIALAPGERTMSALLPPVATASIYQTLDVAVELRSVDAVHSLGVHNVAIQNNASWQGVVAAVHAGGGFRRSADALGERLRIERLRSGEPDPLGLQSRLISLQPDDLPQGPLSYCAWNLVVIDGSAFAQLRAQQCEALARWVAAGGSCAVELAASSQPHHRELLRALRGQEARAGGTLPSTGGLYHCGLGRAFVLDGPLPGDAALDAALRFLWRATDAAGEGEAVQVGYHQEGPGNRQQDLIARYESRLAGALLGTLMPESVQVVPLSVVAVILAVFVLLIGPGDWFLLGLLRRRILTWIAFPLIAAACTLLTLWIAEGYLGSRDYHRSLIVADMNGDGEILRSDRFDLHYRARDSEVVADLAGGLPAVVAQEDYAQADRQRRYRGGYSGAGARIGRPTIVGHYGGAVRFSVHVPQWQPMIMRTLRMQAPELADLPLAWDALATADGDSDADLAQRFGEHGDRVSVWRVDRGGVELSAGAPVTSIELLLGGLSPADDDAPLSGVAPVGGAALRDMASYDPRAGGVLRAVLLRRGEELILLRRYYPEGAL